MLIFRFGNRATLNVGIYSTNQSINQSNESISSNHFNGTKYTVGLIHLLSAQYNGVHQSAILFT